MERIEKLELIQRSLGIRHKLKVHESMRAPETHEDLALSLLARWELEDELRAIEELIAEDRGQNVGKKRTQLIREYLNTAENEVNEPVKKKKSSHSKTSP